MAFVLQHIDVVLASSNVALLRHCALEDIITQKHCLAVEFRTDDFGACAERYCVVVYDNEVWPECFNIVLAHRLEECCRFAIHIIYLRGLIEGAVAAEGHVVW